MPKDGLSGRATVAIVTLLTVTVLGTMSNNIINVPLRAIAADLDESVQTAVLSVLSFSLFLAVSMPLTGWLGDRFGRKQVLAISTALLGAGLVAAAVAPNMPLLIAARGLQGLGCSGIPPLVMGLLVTLRPGQQGRMMGAWATANGAGQAVGPPMGGILADLFGWRSIFVVMATASAVVLWVILRFVPAPPRRDDARLHVPGALLLTIGVGLTLAGASGLSQERIPRVLSGTVMLVGLVTVLAFLLVSRGNPRALVPVRFILEARFARSSIAGFAQMFTLGVALVAIPLFLTGPVGLSQSVAGSLFFALPVTMALLATPIGRLCERLGPRPVLRVGLVVVIAGASGFAWTAGWQRPSVAGTVGLLVVLGVGMAMVQTPAATGATRSRAGRYGAALGLYSVGRFSGSTMGAAWVALLVPDGQMSVIHLGCAAVAGLALATSFMGSPSLPESARPIPVTP